MTIAYSYFVADDGMNEWKKPLYIRQMASDGNSEPSNQAMRLSGSDERKRIISTFIALLSVYTPLQGLKRW